jgi:anti-anti-sigma factor
MVQASGPGCITLSWPAEVEWRARLDLVAAVRASSHDQPLRGVILDLGNVSFLNSAAIGAIFSLNKFAKASGASVVLMRPGRSVSRLLESVNLPSLIPVAATEEEARSHLGGPKAS